MTRHSPIDQIIDEFREALASTRQEDSDVQTCPFSKCTLVRIGALMRARRRKPAGQIGPKLHAWRYLFVKRAGTAHGGKRIIGH